MSVCRNIKRLPVYTKSRTPPAYLIKQFGNEAWQSSYASIKAAINKLKSFPLSGSTPDALEQLNLSQYRQIISGQNRIIYEVRQKTVYVHIVVDTRRDMKSLLTRRLLRVVELDSR